ncbi:hypothetical protein Lsan_4024 [Legionella santicrucis]|uniref:Uncharacterized protein n=1 Tax=Legionella santicrucis TaxID=45074 RepID=A0A0W0YAF3_9GAMM|nr:hypothetical protein [Legionella santicrucis]KTD53614.1 hypothetical protein Lsan_4024 [Legionella santicrucis]
MSVTNIKPISEIYLRVRGELKLLKIALINKDPKKIMSHRTTLHSLTTDFEISLKNNDKNLLIHYRIKEASTNLLMLVQSTLRTASHYQ